MAMLAADRCGKSLRTPSSRDDRRAVGRGTPIVRMEIGKTRTEEHVGAFLALLGMW